MQYRQPFVGDYPITLGFGEEWLPVYKAGEHKGVDYGCPEGTPILASADGVVTKISYDPEGYGNYVLIVHDDGSGTLYAHMKHIMVQRMQRVRKGEQIGMSGSTGKSSGPHLHFELRTQADKQSTAVDPVGYLQNVLDIGPNNSTPAPEKPQFKPVEEGLCVVVCDEANVRCHCDMSRVIKTLKKGEQIYISADVVEYKHLPYRKYWDMHKMCFLMIAEHDPYTQMIENVDPYGEH